MTPTLNFDIKGTGKPIVFLNGFYETREVWSQFITPIKSQYKTICIDLPGFGASQALENTTIESVADTVYENLRSMKIDNFIIVGHSLGGYVALAIAEKYPDSISGLCMFNSTAFEDNEDKKVMRNKTITYLQEHGVESFLKPFVPPLFYPLTRKKFESQISEIIKNGLGLKSENIQAYVEAMRDRPDRTHVLKNAKYPVLYIIGKNDNAVPLQNSIDQCYFAEKSYNLILGNAAHMCMFEKEKESQNMILYFANECLNP